MTTTPALNDDLVRELHERAASYRLGGPSSEHTAALLEQAAEEIEALRAALFVADDMIMTLHGCFPLDRATPEQRALNEGAKFIRSFTSDDYLERKRVVEDFRARTALKGA